MPLLATTAFAAFTQAHRGFSMAPLAPPSLKDIADACGLSTSSVSRALNFSVEDCPLNPRTRARVQQMAHQMGYQANAHARALSSGRSNTAGLILSPHTPMFDGVYQGVITAFSDTLARHGYHLRMIPVAADASWDRSLAGWRVDGCVSLQHLDPQAAEAIAAAGLPCVLLNGRSAAASGSVSPDDRAGARQATEYLLDQGHRDIAMLADLGFERPHYSLYERRAGFEAAMQAAGLGDRAQWIAASFDQAADQVLNARPAPTAVLCYSQQEAVPLLSRLHAAGRRVPQDISLISFNDVFPASELKPSLSVVRVSSQAMGTLGAEMLLRQIRQGRPATPETLVLDETLVLRESSGAASGSQRSPTPQHRV